MTFQELDHLAQRAGRLPEVADLGDRYAYHCLREVYSRYLDGKLEKDAAEVERRKIYQAHRLYREQEAAHLQACKQSQDAIYRAGTLLSAITRGFDSLPAEELLDLCCRCISAMTGEETLTRKYEKHYGGKDDDHDSRTERSNP